MVHRKKFITPFVLPVVAFALTIALGSLLLSLPAATRAGPVAYVDALFIATSCVCVTGLATIDIVTVFTPFGQAVMIMLMQLGGLGITTYSALFFYLLTKRVTLTDRVAVGQTLLNNPSFHIGRFLKRIVFTILSIECMGIAALYMMEPEKIGLFSAVFLGVSAFCNAGFALWTDNLISWQQHIGVNTVVMLLITLGGIGFAVIDECISYTKQWAYCCHKKCMGGKLSRKPSLSYGTKLVLTTSLWLTFGGAACIFITEYYLNDADFYSAPHMVLPALFQSVTCRTAGFSSVDIGSLTDLALMLMVGLMFVGGSAGSCAGGIKTTSFRVLLSFVRANIKGQNQVTVANQGVSQDVINKTLTLLTFSFISICAGVFLLALTEGATKPHGQTPFQLFDLVFEAVSAFATVGLSTGITAKLTAAGKVFLCMLMFIGRLGPIWLVSTIQQCYSPRSYRLPEAEIHVG